MRVLLADRFALQVDMRDHIFSLDLLGKRQNTQNLELTGGLTLLSSDGSQSTMITATSAGFFVAARGRRAGAGR